MSYKTPKAIFISQPMTGLSHEEILRVRFACRENVKLKLKAMGEPANNIYVLDTYKPTDPSVADPSGTSCLFPFDLLADAIAKMALADYICFAPGWKQSRGCQVEHLVAELYEIPILFD